MNSLDVSNAVFAVSSIPAVPTILEVVCRTTGMGFAAVARVTEHRWVACGVRDEIAFGLQPGGELEVETTICSEIRESREAVVIEHVAEDPLFCRHLTPARYGFQAYVSMPIILPGGEFFGTLCAIDPQPRVLKNATTLGMFKLFAELVGFHLDAHFKLEASSLRLIEQERLGTAQIGMIADLEREAEIAKDLIEEQARAERRQRLLQRELVHRMKNTLAMVQAIVTQTLRHTDNAKEASNVIAERLKALSRAQDVLTETNWASADVATVVGNALEAHRDGGRLVVEGPRCEVNAQQALGLSLAIHELATNAAKYGAFSTDSGVVSVNWSVGEHGAFEFTWRESGGPPVVAPTRRGFGSRLMERIVAGYFGGHSEIQFNPAGMAFNLKGSITQDFT